jgi:hypothetical protein
MKDEELEKFDNDLYPEVGPVRQCLKTCRVLKKFSIPANSEGYSLFYPWPLRAVTGRSQPSPTESLFLGPKWMRRLIRPKRGWGIAYLDASAQEIFIAAMLSGDEQLKRDYLDGDIYMTFATVLGKAPAGAKGEDHKKVRDFCKIIFLSVNYGRGAPGLAKELGVSREEAQEILLIHKARYPVFHRWQQAHVNGTKRSGRRLFTPLGWPIWVKPEIRGKTPKQMQRSIRNLPIQAAGSDWMRLVIIMATEAGLRVCCSVHDGFLITSPLETFERDIARMKLIMELASIALFGAKMTIKLEADVRWPVDRAEGPRFDPGEEANATWDLVMAELTQLKGLAAFPGSARGKHQNAA